MAAGIVMLRWEGRQDMATNYDLVIRGGTIGSATGSFRADLEVDFLGLFGGPAEIDDGFLALYRANDRVGLGLSYVY